MRTVLYPGTFNPIHNGHIDLVRRAAGLFDRVVLGVATSPQKNPSVLEVRVNLAREALQSMDNVEVIGFNTLTVDFAREVGASVILKGIRTVTDFEYEFQMLNMNRALSPGLETVFLAPSEEHSYISSTLVRQIAGYGGDVSQFVPPAVAAAIKAGEAISVATNPETTFQGGDGGSIQVEGVIANAAVLHISAATTIEAVITGITDEGFGRSCSGEGVSSGGTELIDEGLGEGTGGGAKDYITLAGISSPIGISAKGTHKQIGEAIAIHITGSRN